MCDTCLHWPPQTVQGVKCLLWTERDEFIKDACYARRRSCYMLWKVCSKLAMPALVMKVPASMKSLSSVDFFIYGSRYAL